MTCSTTTATPRELGKNVGDDLREGKPTLPLLIAMERGSADERRLIRQAIEKRRGRSIAGHRGDRARDGRARSDARCRARPKPTRHGARCDALARSIRQPGLCYNWRFSSVQRSSLSARRSRRVPSMQIGV